MMTTRLTAVAAAALALGWAGTAPASDEEILAHYDAYEAAMAAGDYARAEVEADAAWRGAEAEWGGTEETAILAFNLTRLRLMSDRRAEAVEPAQRMAELVASGAAGGSITPQEAAAFTALAAFDPLSAPRGQARDLEQAFDDYAPSDLTSTRIALIGWYYVADSYARLEAWRDAYRSSQRAEEIVSEDASAELPVRATLAYINARAAYETDRVIEGINAAQRGIAAFPPQPPGQPIEPSLGTLLVMDAALRGLYGGRDRREYVQSDPALANPAWDDARFATGRGCTLTWANQPFPPFRPGGRSSGGMGAVFEFSLDGDGRVTNVTQLSPLGEEEHAFGETLRGWRARAPESEECRGPYHFATGLLLPRRE